jgi:hypothetical protein
MKNHVRYILGLVAALLLAVGWQTPARALDIGVSVGIAPPPLPVYVQPACPGLGYMWTPGYWAWDADINDYYWVPGAWVEAPEVGLYWTPPYWGWANGNYVFNAGYWGPSIGFYGGVNYGYGYNGYGYYGGYWNHDHFYYNREVNNVANIRASYAYSKEVADNRSRVSFNGGNGGTNLRATNAQLAAAHQHHIRATTAQRSEVRAAKADPSQRFAANHGTPAVTGTPRAGDYRAANARTASATQTPRAADTASTGKQQRAAAAKDTTATAQRTASAEKERTASADKERTASAEKESAASAERERAASAQRTASAEREHAAVERQHASAQTAHVAQTREPAVRAAAPAHVAHAAPSGGGAHPEAHAAPGPGDHHP